MPGADDPCSFLLPQQAFHPCMLPQATRLETLNLCTNPHACDIDGVAFVGSSGTPHAPRPKPHASHHMTHAPSSTPQAPRLTPHATRPTVTSALARALLLALASGPPHP